MPKGHKTPPEKEEQTIALAQTSMTQEEIAEIVGISRRQVFILHTRIADRHAILAIWPQELADRCLVLAEGVEEVGAEIFFATIVLASRT